MPIVVKSECTVPASGTSRSDGRTQHYVSHEGLARIERRMRESQSDTADCFEYRRSEDNGRTWGDWWKEQPLAKVKVGEDEYEFQTYPDGINIWNPVHRHYITLTIHRLFLGGYQAATDRFWNEGINHTDHAVLEITNEARTETVRQVVAYEDGITDLSPEYFHDEAFWTRNIGMPAALKVMKNGDILFDMAVPIQICCRLCGMDVERFFPSTGNKGHAAGVLIGRGVWNAEKNRYDLTFSEPVMVNDQQSSRGMGETAIAELESGKILIIMRGSTLRYKPWKQRISPCMPGYKFFSISEDGGKTFSPPMPWYFDSREVVYSSSTFSTMLRSSKNGKLYWIGNMTEPTKTDGNMPRYPLHIVEVDEEWGYAKKETLTEIDTRRDGETDEVQLSNFSLIEDRETGNFELRLVKYGQFPNTSNYNCESWKYTIILPD